MQPLRRFRPLPSGSRVHRQHVDITTVLSTVTRTVWLLSWPMCPCRASHRAHRRAAGEELPRHAVPHAQDEQQQQLEGETTARHQAECQEEEGTVAVSTRREQTMPVAGGRGASHRAVRCCLRSACLTRQEQSWPSWVTPGAAEHRRHPRHLCRHTASSPHRTRLSHTRAHSHRPYRLIAGKRKRLRQSQGHTNTRSPHLYRRIASNHRRCQRHTHGPRRHLFRHIAGKGRLSLSHHGHAARRAHRRYHRRPLLRAMPRAARS